MAKKKEVVVEAPQQEISVEDKLTALYQLQSVASEIDRIRTLRGELPVEVQELEDEIEGRHTRYHRYEEELVELKAKVDQARERARVAQQLIEKYKEQLNAVRNNREYDLLSKEVEYQTLEVESCEKQVTRAIERSEAVKDEMAQLSGETEERQNDLKAKRSELDAIVEETKQEEEKLHQKAKELEKLIDERLLTAFKRTRKSVRNGLSVVAIDREACMGCFNKIPPQRILDVQARKKIIACEYCGRILVDLELANDAQKNLDMPKSEK